MSPKERLDSLNLSEDTQEVLSEMALDTNILNNLIENQISEFELPMGLAQNFVINGKEYIVPMVTEEPSVIAAASNGAKIAESFTAKIDERLMRGQIVFYDVKKPEEIIETEPSTFDPPDLKFVGGGFAQGPEIGMPKNHIIVQNYEKYLKNEANHFPNPITLEEKAEGKYLAVAVSSIIARDLFLENLENLGKELGYQLPSGAGTASDKVASQILQAYGMKGLNFCAKLHFKNTEKAKKLLER